ncbi:hypothetical protein HDU98_004091 [Podochytrium sp. JEL0797]|nr:hypothetical protein HDU98_004091 [Podochytrium sp. JEL0797]
MGFLLSNPPTDCCPGNVDGFLPYPQVIHLIVLLELYLGLATDMRREQVVLFQMRPELLEVAQQKLSIAEIEASELNAPIMCSRGTGSDGCETEFSIFRMKEGHMAMGRNNTTSSYLARIAVERMGFRNKRLVQLRIDGTSLGYKPFSKKAKTYWGHALIKDIRDWRTPDPALVANMARKSGKAGSSNFLPWKVKSYQPVSYSKTICSFHAKGHF